MSDADLRNKQSFVVVSPRHVAGLNVGRARNIAEWREQNGPFINREQLKLVKGMGPKTYQQCAGFIRINPQTLHRWATYECRDVIHRCTNKGLGSYNMKYSGICYLLTGKYCSFNYVLWFSDLLSL